MSLLSFLKNKKKKENKFIGRYQQRLSAYILLGEEINESELEKAIGNDIIERAEILGQIEMNEENSISDLKVNYAPSSLDVHTRTLEIIRNGYRKGVLQNDLTLENRCFELVQKARNRILDLVASDQKESTEKALSEMESLTRATRAFFSFELGDILTKKDQQDRFDTTDTQKAWFILLLITQPQTIISDFTIVPPDTSDLKVYSDKIRDLAKKLLNTKAISSDTLNEINTRLDSIITHFEQLKPLIK